MIKATKHTQAQARTMRVIIKIIKQLEVCNGVLYLLPVLDTGDLHSRWLTQKTAARHYTDQFYKGHLFAREI